MVKLFGTTIRETLWAFEPVHMGSEQSAGSKSDKTKAIGRIIVTVLLIASAIYLISTNTNKELGITIISAVIGYWLK